MKSKLILLFALALSGLVTGCETEHIQHSHAVASNLQGDNHSETFQMSDNGNGRLKNGALYALFPLGHSHLLVIFYPTNALNQRLRTETGSHQVYAWLVRNQFLDSPTYGHFQEEITAAESPANPAFSDAEQLHGQVEIEQGDWRHKNRFHVGIDLTGENGVTVKGEFDAYDRLKFDPNTLWLAPYMIIFGPFVEW